MFIKQEVDRDRRPGRFLVTGSADLDLAADQRARIGPLFYRGEEPKRLASNILAVPLWALLA